MFTNLDLFKASYEMARHAGTRQTVTAANIANADTPGYRARSVASFADAYTETGATGLRATRGGHRSSDALASGPRIEFSGAETSPNGNSVSLEHEMVQSIEIQREHSRALAIYKHSLDLLRMSIGRG